ncbi:hypothetical protein CHISP_2686 [Chitinispirillum alkaliphilum]|nr:hypothetical protein CHISP_2686 [Chitinispirillum alkaliphilum]
MHLKIRSPLFLFDSVPEIILHHKYLYFFAAAKNLVDLHFCTYIGIRCKK